MYCLKFIFLFLKSIIKVNALDETPVFSKNKKNKKVHVAIQNPSTATTLLKIQKNGIFASPREIKKLIIKTIEKAPKTSNKNLCHIEFCEYFFILFSFSFKVVLLILLIYFF